MDKCKNLWTFHGLRFKDKLIKCLVYKLCNKLIYNVLTCINIQKNAAFVSQLFGNDRLSFVIVQFGNI